MSIRPLQPWSWAQLQHATNNTVKTEISLEKCEARFNTAASAQYGPQVFVIDIMVGSVQYGQHFHDAAPGWAVQPKQVSCGT